MSPLPRRVPPKPSTKPSRKNGVTAFSLVEIVLAIGIVGFAMLSIIGMLPIGLKSVQTAESLQATGNIANQLRGQMQMLSFNASGTNTIQQLAQNTLYYTLDGIPTNSDAGYYKATFTVQNVSSTANQVVDATFNAGNARSVRVDLLSPPGVWNRTNTFSLLVARQTGN